MPLWPGDAFFGDRMGSTVCNQVRVQSLAGDAEVYVQQAQLPVALVYWARAVPLVCELPGGCQDGL